MTGPSAGRGQAMQPPSMNQTASNFNTNGQNTIDYSPRYAGAQQVQKRGHLDQ